MFQFKVKTPAGPSQPLLPHSGQSVASLQKQLQLLYTQSGAWVSQHSLQILIASAIGAVIVAILAGLRTLGLRLCRGAVRTWGAPSGRGWAPRFLAYPHGRG